MVESPVLAGVALDPFLGREAIRVLDALAIAVVERVEDEDLRSGRDDGAAPTQLDSVSRESSGVVG